MKKYLAIKNDLNENTKRKIFEIDNCKYRAHVGVDGIYYLTDANDFSKIVLMTTPEFYKLVFEQNTAAILCQTLLLSFSLTEDNRCSSVIMAPNRIFSLYSTGDGNYCVTDHTDETKIYMYITTDLWDAIFENKEKLRQGDE